MIYIFSQTRFLFLYFFLHFLCRFQSALGRIAAGNHESYVRQMFFFVQRNSSGGGPAMGDGLYDFIMTVCGTGCLRQMSNTEDLNGMREEGNLSGHLKAYSAANAHVDFIKNQGLLLEKAGDNDFDVQRKTGNFTAASRVLHATKMFAHIGREIEFHFFRAVRKRRFGR